MRLPESSHYPWLWDKTLFLTKHGSHAYGLNTPTSDLDLRGFCVPPKEYLFGYRDTFEQSEFIGDPDIVVWDIRKFFRLAAKCNPNVIEVLFTEPDDHVICMPRALEILRNKDLFLTSKAYDTFGGYAHQALKKLSAQFASTNEYDTKDAMHLVRLMRVCKGILEDGKVQVKRQDREELLRIRAGMWSYLDIRVWARECEDELTKLVKSTSLPKEPDHDKLNKLLVDIVHESCAF